MSSVESGLNNVIIIMAVLHIWMPSKLVKHIEVGHLTVNNPCTVKSSYMYVNY